MHLKFDHKVSTEIHHYEVVHNYREGAFEVKFVWDGDNDKSFLIAQFDSQIAANEMFKELNTALGAIRKAASIMYDYEKDNHNDRS